MRFVLAIGLLVGLVVGARCIDLLHRVQSPDMAAVAFAEGGDDGYYVFTIARNVAAGYGITIDRVNWTSGFQPLWTLLCSLPYLVAGDRGAFVLIYAASVAFWLASALLLLRVVRDATGREIPSAAAVLIAALFLCEAHLNRNYISGLETGLYLMLCLALFLAFQRRLTTPETSLAEAAWPGAICGVTMLARNDAIFLCTTLLAMTLLSGDWRSAFKQGLVTVGVAAAIVSPWLAYCYWLSGDPMPQSGIATSIALRGGRPEAETVLHAIVVSLVPLLIVKTRTLIDEHLLVAAVVVAASASMLLVFRRSWMPATTRGFRLALAGFTAGAVALVSYYIAASWAGHFFERYFIPLKLIVMLLLALAVVEVFDRRQSMVAARTAFAALAIGAVASNLYWIGQDYDLPFRGYMGEQAYSFARSPFARDGSRLGIAESGRLGFMYPDRVVNLDGKMRVDALRALRDRKIGEFLEMGDFDYVVLHPHDVDFFDKLSPDWRDGYRPAGRFMAFEVFARIR